MRSYTVVKITTPQDCLHCVDNPAEYLFTDVKEYTTMPLCHECMAVVIAHIKQEHHAKELGLDYYTHLVDSEKELVDSDLYTDAELLVETPIPYEEEDAD